MKRKPIKEHNPSQRSRIRNKPQKKQEQKKKAHPPVTGFHTCQNTTDDNDTCVWTPTGCGRIADNEILNQVDRYRGVAEIELAGRRKARTTPLLPHVKCRLVRNLCLDRPKDIRILTGPGVKPSSFDTRPRNCRVMRQRIVRKLSNLDHPLKRIPLDLRGSDGDFVLTASHMDHIFLWVDSTYFDSTLRDYLSPYVWQIYTAEDDSNLATTSLTRNGSILFRFNLHMIRGSAFLSNGIWADSLLEALIVTVEHELIHAIMERYYQDRESGESGHFVSHGTEFLTWARFLYGHSGLDFTASADTQEKKSLQIEDSLSESDDDESDNKSLVIAVVKKEPTDDMTHTHFMHCEERVLRTVAERMELLWLFGSDKTRLATPSHLLYLFSTICTEYNLDQKLALSSIFEWVWISSEKKAAEQQSKDTEEEDTNMITLEYKFKKDAKGAHKPLLTACIILLDEDAIRSEVEGEYKWTHGALLSRLMEFAYVHFILTFDHGPEFGRSHADRASIRTMCMKTFGHDRILVRLLRLGTRFRTELL